MWFRSKSIRAVCILISALVVLISGCSEKSVTPDGGDKYWLYASDIGNKWIYRIDTETDSLVDSINYSLDPNSSPVLIEASKDGRYLYASFHRLDGIDALIYDAQTLEQITWLPEHGYPVFIEEENLMLQFMPSDSSTVVMTYFLPGFAVSGVDTIDFPLSRPRLNEFNGLIYGFVSYDRSQTDSICLGIYDHTQNTSEVVPILDSEDLYYNLSPYAMALNGHNGFQYFVGSAGTQHIPGDNLLCYDSDHDTLIFAADEENMPWILEIAASPDLNELFAVSRDDIGPGQLRIYDLSTGALKNYLELVVEDNDNIIPLDLPNTMAITPDNEKIYIGSGQIVQWEFEQSLGTITVINAGSAQITKHIWPDTHHFILGMTIAPKR